MNLKIHTEISIIAYLIVSFIFAIFWENVAMFAALFAIFLGMTYSKEHEENIWKTKYTLLLEKELKKK